MRSKNKILEDSRGKTSQFKDISLMLKLDLGLKSWYPYRPMVFSINIMDTSHFVRIRNISPSIRQNYRVNTLSGTSNMILPIFETIYRNLADI